MRASAWYVLCILSCDFAYSIYVARYHYGYTHNKSAFAWLGERYLNEIKACK